MRTLADFLLYNLAPSLLAGLWATALLLVVVRVFRITSARLRSNMLFIPLVKSSLVLLSLTTAIPFVAGSLLPQVEANALPFRSVWPLYAIWLAMTYLGLQAMRSRMAMQMTRGSQLASPDSRVAQSMERMLALFRTKSIMEICSTDYQLVSRTPRPDLYITSEGASPVVVVSSPPTLVVPEPLIAELDEKELDSVIAHELAHISIERSQLWCDVTLRRMLTLSSPTGYLVNRIVAHDDELACDEISAQVTGQPEALASALVKTHRYRTRTQASTRRAAPIAVAALLGNKQPLSQRINRLLSANYGQLELGTSATLRVMAAWAVVCVLVFSV